MSEFRDELTGLIRAFERSPYSVLEVSQGSTRIYLRRTPPEQPAAQASAQAPAASAAGPSAGAEAPREPVETSGVLTSPRVGRFFQLQDAQGQPVLKSGTRLSVGQVYGIIESMHLRYEIRSERDGVVERVLVPSGEPVGYGQPLVLLAP